ncbi:alpha-L-rhamnosidase C-terminal domain-containing protein [Streptomyces sp. NPDC058045]|uniref:alpha-L-rhamnosidase-related protein n=1 Tax=Streptomyces sp. NPDC058045 TaxID=3346311 RepID=UPI0036E0F61D
MPQSAGAEPGPQRRSVLRAGAVAAATAAGLGAAPAEAAPRGTAAGTRHTSPTRAVRERARKAPSGRWDTFNLSPARRTVRPTAVRTTTGAVERARDLLGKPGAARTRLLGAGSSVTLDFGKEVGGHVTVGFGADCDPDQAVGLTYSELSTYISTSHSDGSSARDGNEPAVRYAVWPGGQLATDTDRPLSGAEEGAADRPQGQLRGGFRYVTVVNTTEGAVALSDVSVRITFAPDTADLRAYPNYFYCDDDLLNRIWYAGAYTVQTNIVAAEQGRAAGTPSVGWDNSARIAEPGGTVLVDGAKRDRSVWPGDLGVALLTDYVSLGELAAVRTSLDVLYRHQAPDGALPYGSSAAAGESDTYHLWTLVGTAEYVRFSGDTAWFSTVRERYRRALGYIVAKIDRDGLLDVTRAADWARRGGGKNLEANALLHRALVTASALAGTVGDERLAADCSTRAARLKSAVEKAGYWDESAGLYRDRPDGPGASLHPQDGNALAVWFGLADGPRARAVSTALAGRWTAVGALTPEKHAAAVHPFPGSMEVHAHFAAGRAGTALDLIRREWGYMLGAPHGTASTFWEGYRTDGTSDYHASYMSAAHGWATGPTSALTFWLLGVSPVADGSAGHRVMPHPGGLEHAQGRLTTASGVISVSWRVRPNGWFDLSVSSPQGLDDVAVPVPEEGPTVIRRGRRRAWDRSSRFHGTRLEDGYVHLGPLPAGGHTITVRRR